MILWQEQDTDANHQPPEQQTVELSFRLRCTALPVDHGLALKQALLKYAPWSAEIPHAGVHNVHVAGSQNGWQRPQAERGETLLLSRRTRLHLRLPAAAVERLQRALEDQTLDIDGHAMQLHTASIKPVLAAPCLFARYVWYAQLSPAASEDEFTNAVIANCQQMGYAPTKLLCGRGATITTDKGQLHTRSVLLDDVPPLPAQMLLQQGLGSERLNGCGLLLAHKSTAAVN